MADETNETGTVVDSTNDYIETIKTLKQNSVDRSEYDKLRAENRKLLDAVVNGQPGQDEQQQVVATEEEIQALRRDLFDPERDHTNLDYVSKALQLREMLMSRGEPDPFIPAGHQVSPTRDDIEIAQKVAEVYQECIDASEGDSGVFTSELMRRTKDVRINKK